MAKICHAVQHAQQRGIIDCDWKPATILMDDGRQLKVLDFGMVLAAESDARATQQTGGTKIIGTLVYMSPEQVLGDPLDTRRDVYALGMILYALLAGQGPYKLSSDPLGVVRAIVEEDPAPLSSASRTYHCDIETIVAKGLEKDKGRRYARLPA